MHVQCNEAQCSQGPESISKCLNTSLTILFFYLRPPFSTSGLCSETSLSLGLSLFSGFRFILQLRKKKKTESTMLM